MSPRLPPTNKSTRHTKQTSYIPLHNRAILLRCELLQERTYCEKAVGLSGCAFVPVSWLARYER
jgi:hypothetical protein